MTAINWSSIFKRYRGLWVALAQDEKTVLAAAKTAKDAFNKAKKKVIKDLFLPKCRKNLLITSAILYEVPL